MDPPSQVPETATSSGMVRLHAARRVRAALLKLRTLSCRQRVVTISASCGPECLIMSAMMMSPILARCASRPDARAASNPLAILAWPWVLGRATCKQA